VYGVWVTAKSRKAACDLAERMWRDSREAMSWRDGGIEHIELLDECEADIAALKGLSLQLCD